MDALIAGIIVALISAVAFIAVALITARARIGVLPAKAVRDSSNPPHDSSNPSHVQSDLSESAKQFRVLGWVLVVILYLVATFCLLQGLNDLRIVFHWEQWEAYFGSIFPDRAEIVLYFRFWIAAGIALIFIAYWAQRRLRRRST